MKHFTIALLAASLFCAAHAQDKPDPFAKKNAPHPAPPPARPQDITTVLAAFETYSLPQDVLDDLLTEGLAPALLQERILALISEGKATLDNVMALPVDPGTQATSDSTDQVMCPTEFKAPTAEHAFAFPSAWEMHPVGDRLQIQATVNPDRKEITLELRLESTRLAGFTKQKASPPDKGGAVSPLFTTATITGTYICPEEQPVFLGTMSTPFPTGIVEAETPGQISVAFVRVRAAGRGTASTPVANAPLPPPWHAVFRAFSMNRKEARLLLAGTADGDKLHLQMKDLVKRKAAQLERLIVANAGSGQAIMVEESAAHMYGTEITPGGSGPGFFSAFETRPLGWRIDLQPVDLADDRGWGLTVGIGLARYRGFLQGDPLFDLYPTMPIYSEQQVHTAVTMPLGHAAFLGTFNPPRDNGVNNRKDDARTWMLFVESRKD